MSAWLDVDVKDWPRRVRVRVLLKDGSESGADLSGDVTLVIRKNNKPATTRKLGADGKDLVIKVENGPWFSPAEGWNWKYWFDRGFNTVVAQYNDNGEIRERYWSSVSLAREADDVPRPTSITKIVYTKAVVTGHPDQMRYALVWVINSQFGKPISGLIQRAFDGMTVPISSHPDQIGVCVDTVIVTGYGREMFYTVIPPVGAPQIITLTGPSQSAPITPKVYAIEADLESPHPVSGKFMIAGTFSVDGKLADFTSIVSSSPENCKVETRLGKVEPGTDPDTYKLTSSAGKFRLVVPADSFQGDLLELQLTAPNGVSATVPMVKPRRW